MKNKLISKSEKKENISFKKITELWGLKYGKEGVKTGGKIKGFFYGC